MSDQPLPEALRAWRARMGYSQTEAHARLGVPLKTLQSWEQGVRRPTGFTLAQLEKILTRKKTAK